MENILEKINEASLKLLTPLLPEETYIMVVNEAIKLVGAHHGSIFLERNRNLQRLYASVPGLYESTVRKRGNTYMAYKTGKPAVISIATIKKIHPQIKEMGIKSTILIPLSYKNESIGVLSIDSLKSEHFTQRELNILKLFGSMATLAIKKSQLYDEIKSALQIRDVFIAMAAHELRTPLTSISGYIQLLRKKFANQDTTEARWVEELYHENNRLTSLVTELLEVNRIKTGQLEFTWQECYLQEVIERAIIRLKFTYPDRTVTVEGPEENVIIIGDKERLLLAIFNILENAAKYSPDNSPITISVQQKKSEVTLTITDKGRGIEKEHVNKVFQGYLKGNKNGEEGMGLGLYLAEHIIKEHHGAVSIQSKLHKGTSVKIKLPKTKV